MDITAFRFTHSASYADGCYSFAVTQESGGTHLYAEELFSRGRIVDVMIEEPVLEQLGEVAATYRVDLWNGFDKSDSRVLDGSGFRLEITLADGSTISARGSNRFPKRYSEVLAAVQTLYDKYMGQYGLSEEERAQEDGTKMQG